MTKYILLFVLLVAPCAAMDNALFLKAVELREQGHGKVGLHGELGPYQMAPAAVKECGGYGLASAVEYLMRIEDYLRAKRVDVTPFNCALAWNAGRAGATTGRAPVRAYEYARAVTALYENLQR